MSGVLVGACVLAGVLLLRAGSPRRRLWAWGDRAPGVAPPRRRRAWRPTRRAGQAADDVATAVAELSVLLRSGLPPALAWGHLVAAGPEADTLLGAALARAARAAREGDDVAGALRSAAVRSGAPRDPRLGPALLSLAATWHVAQRSGAPTAEVLARYAAALRADLDSADARDAAMAAPRATAKLLTGLPPAGLLLGTLVGADPLTVLTGTTAGRLSAVVGAVCTGAGWWWTRRLVAAAQRVA